MSTSVGAAPATTAETPPATPALLSAMLRAATKISDLIFSPGRPPIVEQDGRLLAVRVQGLPVLTADHTQRIAADLIGTNKHALDTLREQGACDISYGLPGNARFRVNVFMQRGSCAIAGHPRRDTYFCCVETATGISGDYRVANWHRIGNRTHRVRKVFYPGCDH